MMAVTNHFKDRAKERFGLNLSKSDIQAIKRQINNRSFVEKSVTGHNIHRVHFNDELMYAVCDGGIIVTCLTAKQYLFNNGYRGRK